VKKLGLRVVEALQRWAQVFVEQPPLAWNPGQVREFVAQIEKEKEEKKRNWKDFVEECKDGSADGAGP
jgi:hypothetical protein